MTISRPSLTLAVPFLILEAIDGIAGRLQCAPLFCRMIYLKVVFMIICKGHNDLKKWLI